MLPSIHQLRMRVNFKLRQGRHSLQDFNISFITCCLSIEFFVFFKQKREVIGKYNVILQHVNTYHFLKIL